MSLGSCSTVPQILGACPALQQNGEEELRCTKCKRTGPKGFVYAGVFAIRSTEEIKIPPKNSVPRHERKKIVKNNKAFQNLKKSIKRHQEACESDNRDEALNSRSKKVGLTVGRVAYTIIKEALPYSKFDKLLLTMSLRDTEIGNINHSRFFVTNFLDNIKDALSEKLVNYLSTPLIQTNFKVPVSIVDDLATYQRKTRQFICAIIPMMDSESLLAAVPLTAKLIASGGRTGEGLAESIHRTLDNFSIEYNQLVSCTWDGAYIHENVGARLIRRLGIPSDDIHIFYDPMHKGGRAEVNILKDKNSESFVRETVGLVTQVNDFLKWGNRNVRLNEVAKEHNLKLYALSSIPQTRMANYTGILIFLLVKHCFMDLGRKK